MRIQIENDVRQMQLNEKIELKRAENPDKNVERNKNAGTGKAGGTVSGEGKASVQGKALQLAENMEKAEQLKAGMNLIEGQKKLEQVREEQEKKEEDGNSEENGSEEADQDRVRLSGLSRHLFSGARERAYLWTLEMEMELWEALLKWRPSGQGEDLRQKLQELSRIYQFLLNELMENTEGDNRTLQLVRLNQGLSLALNGLKESSLNELFGFLEQFGGGKSLADLRTSLYFHVTGRTLSAKEADAFWNAGKQGAGVSSGLRGNSPSDGGRRLDGGQLYRSQSMSGGRARDEGSGFGGQAARGGALGNQNGNQREGGRARSGSQIPGRAAETGGFGKAKSGGFSGGSGNLMTGEETGRGTGAGGAALRGRSAYLSSMKSGEEAVFMAAGRGTQAGVYAGGGAKGRTSYTSYSMEDVQKAESFVRYLDRGGNLFKSREITAENEELLGCLCADLEMKGQLFADGFRVGDRMKTTVRSAVGNMIDCYLKEAEHRIQAGQDNCPLNRKAVYGVYYYILKQYQQKKDPALILDEGILYASNMFEEKKKEEGYRQAERYSREAGFFGAGSSKEEEKNGRRKGRRLFSDSWGRYMQLAERYGGGYRELMQTSPWGMGLSPEPVRGKNILGKTAAVLGVSAAVAGAAYWLSYMLR